jgi:hypothetical protein
MKTNVGITKRIVAACVVATGIAILWATGVGWIGLIGQTLLPAGGSTSDSFQVALDGTPVIRTSKNTSEVSLLVDLRTLDGKPWPVGDDNWLGGAYLPAPYQPPRLVETPLPWDSGFYGRISGVTDGKDPPAAWYFVRDNGRTGEVYVTGFDAISKLPIGYIGRNGFLASKPPLSEQFNVPLSAVDDGFSQLIDCGQELVSRRLVRSYQMTDDRPSFWTVSLLGTDCLWEVDLRQRTVRKRMQFDGAMSISGTRVRREVYDQLPTQLPDERTEKEKERQKKAVNPEEKDEVAYLTAVRERDRVIVFNLHEGKRETFLLPEVLLNRRFSAFVVGPDQMLVDAFEQHDEYWSGGPIVRLFWFDRLGKIQREKELKLAGWTPPSPRARARNASIAIPVPIVWIAGIMLGAPLHLLQINYVTDFASGLSFVADIAWPPLIAVVILAAALAWLTVRLQRKYRRRGSAAWAVFVFLLGVPGFLAYLIENRRAKLEACSQCGETVPRDREVCADCNTEFAPPARVGTEIFA